jgi:hypothetical protein
MPSKSMLNAVRCSAVTKARSLQNSKSNKIKFVPKEPKPRFHYSTVSFDNGETRETSSREKREA